MKAKTARSPFNLPQLKVSFRTSGKPHDHPKITSSLVAYEILRDNWDNDTIELQEQFYLLLLNASNDLIGITKIASGGVSSVCADPKLIFAIALKSCASYIIIAHNHPSGSVDPGQIDIDYTHKLRDAGKLLDIGLIDHLIITKDSYSSLTDDDLMN